MARDLKYILFATIIAFCLASCNTHKLTYYYAKMESPNSASIKYDDSFFTFANIIDNEKDTVVLMLHFADFREDNIIELSIKNNIPIFLDFRKSEIWLNGKLTDTKNSGMYRVAPSYSYDRSLLLGTDVRTISSLTNWLLSIYEKQTYPKEDIKYIETIYPNQAEALYQYFTPSNTPLNLQIDLTYYKDSLYTKEYHLKGEVYQSKLIKIANIEKAEGERLRSNDDLDISFCTNDFKGSKTDWAQVKTDTRGFSPFDYLVLPFIYVYTFFGGKYGDY